MKKTFLIGILIVTIITSMVAGTLAVYSNTIQETGAADALRFYIGTSETKTTDLKLAPGASDEFTFNVTNVNPTDNAVTEVPMDLSITTTIPEGFGQIDVELAGVENAVKTVNEDGSVTFTAINWCAASVEKTNRVELNYTWVDDNDSAMQYNVGGGNDSATADSGFTVTVTGTQHVGD